MGSTSVYTPKILVDRKVAVAELGAIAQKVEERWRVDGITDKEMEEMILEEVQTVRAEHSADKKR